MTKERKVLVIRLRATQMCDVCRTFFFKKTQGYGAYCQQWPIRNKQVYKKSLPCAQLIFYQIKNLIQLRDFQPAVAPVFASSTFTRWFLVPQSDFRQATSSFWQHRGDFGNYILFILDVLFSFTITNIALSNFGQMNVIMKEWLKPQNLENYPH